MPACPADPETIALYIFLELRGKHGEINKALAAISEHHEELGGVEICGRYLLFENPTRHPLVRMVAAWAAKQPRGAMRSPLRRNKKQRRHGGARRIKRRAAFEGRPRSRGVTGRRRRCRPFFYPTPRESGNPLGDGLLNRRLE